MSVLDNLNPIAATAASVGNAVEKVAGVFTSNAENDAQRAADEQTALLRAYQEEFTNRENRNWVDSLADGFNRLVRPLIASTVLFVFVLAYVNPEYFARVTLALSTIPNGYWALLSVVIGFYFGGRMQIKSQDFEFRQSQVDAVKALIETKKEFR
ncbi:MAG TPA: 3TM-type holin, partial [Rhodocyclaceae bacterium]